MKKRKNSWLLLEVAPRLIAAYLKLVYRTWRYSWEGEEKAEALWGTGAGVIVCVWHARILLGPRAWDRSRGAPEPRMLISKSADGEFITRVAGHIGYPAIRGSRQRADSVGAKGGDKAYREMVRWVGDGGGICIPPDGPKGPAEVIGLGAPSLARLTGAPVLLLGMASSPCWRLKTWDRTVIPRPFAHTAMVWEGPFQVGSEDDLGEVAAAWTQVLRQATARAEALAE